MGCSNPSDSQTDSACSQSVPLTTPNAPTATTTHISTTTSKPENHRNLSNGDIAGIAIATFAIGALIAGGVFFFLYRRQKKRHTTRPYVHQTVPYSEPLKGGAVVGTRDRGGSRSNIDNLLPQPVEDDALTKELSRLRDNIKNHVRSYYHSQPVAASAINELTLGDLAGATGISTSALANLLLNTSSRGEVIRLYISWVLLSRCTGDRYPSLLPPEVARLAMSIPGRNGMNAAQLSLYSKWKTITGVLLQPRYGRQEPNGGSPSIAETITDLDAVLAPFVQGSVDGDQRRRNLEMFLSRAASFAFLLFTQPGSFHFDFASQSRGLPVFPGFVQTIGDQGQTLSPPRALAEKEIAAAHST